MRYGLSELAAAEIETLEAEGITLKPQDVLRIARLADRIETPRSRMQLARGTPVMAGGVYLWPMTISSAHWYQHVGGHFDGTAMQTFALAYAMANGRDDLDYDLETAAKAVKAWSKRLRCRSVELVEAIRQVIAQDEISDGEDADKKSGGESGGFSEISTMLAAMTKTDPAIWERQCSMSYAVNMLDTIIKQNMADGKSTAGDPRIRAERALGLAIAQIRRRNGK